MLRVPWALVSVENPLLACGLHVPVILGLNPLDHETLINMVGGKADSTGWGPPGPQSLVSAL